MRTLKQLQLNTKTLDTISKPLFLQADKDKKVKKKKAKEDAPAEEAPAPAAAAPAASGGSDRASSRGSRKAAKRTGSNVFSMFSQKQVAEFKEVGLETRIYKL